MSIYFKIEKIIRQEAEKNGNYYAYELSEYCEKNGINIVDAFRNFSPRFQEMLRDEFVERKLVKESAMPLRKFMEG